MLAELHDARDTAVPTVCAALGLCAVTYAAVGVLVALVFWARVRGVRNAARNFRSELSALLVFESVSFVTSFRLHAY